MAGLFPRVYEQASFDGPIRIPCVDEEARVAVIDKPAGIYLDVIKLPVQIRLRQAVSIYPAIKIMKCDAVKIEALRRNVSSHCLDAAGAFVALGI